MYTLFSCFKRYNATLRSQTEAMSPETRQSLTQKIVETLNEGGSDVEGGSENVEAILDQVRADLLVAQQQLAALEEKDRFLDTRIKKYTSMLQEQEEHLKQLQQQIDVRGNEDNADQQAAEQLHYEEQAAKSQKHREALGKVVDVHMDILKNIKSSKRTIATLEEKETELKAVTQKCREFLVMAEEAEREQQFGIVSQDENEFNAMEVEPMVALAAKEEEEDRRQSLEEKEDATGSSRTADDAEDHGEEEAGSESKGLLSA